MSWWNNSHDEEIAQSQQNVDNAQQQFNATLGAIEQDMEDYRQQLDEAQRQANESQHLVDKLMVNWRGHGT